MVIGGGLFFYSRFIEPNWPRVREVTISDNRLRQAWGEIRIAQISDLHIEKSGRREQKVLQILLQLNPDLIVFTGDSAQWFQSPKAALQFLQQLNAPLGVFGVMGDADFSCNRRHCLFCHPENDYHNRRHDFTILDNETVTLPLPGKPRQPARELRLIGINPNHGPGNKNPGQPDFLMEQLTAESGQGQAQLILGHFSKNWATITQTESQAGPLLWLAGDTHGGQIRLPARLWRILKVKPDPEHMAGLYRGLAPGQWLYVNRGIGTTASLPLRLGVRPEITLLTFAAEKTSN